MRIAFLGKGGSGKTTVSSLFALYADSQKYRVSLLDVDVNSHTAEVLGVETTALSSEQLQADIHTYLAGENPRVKPDEFLNTTPPGTGSGRWTFDSDNMITRRAGAPFGDAARMYTTGTYKDNLIGVDCHHGTQTIAENLLSHAQLGEKDLLVIDSVAGNDAFGTSLYFQDMLVLIVKPEREGIKVFERFYALAEAAGVADRVFVVGNQVMSDAQEAFLERNLPEGVLLGYLPISERIIEDRLEDIPLQLTHVNETYRTVFARILKKATELAMPEQAYYHHYVALHKKVANESWVAGSYRTGMEDQIDETYRPDVA